ncbi:MAG: hypothetical protein AB1714_13845 [Acidobacteriota bacterium]
MRGSLTMMIIFATAIGFFARVETCANDLPGRKEGGAISSTAEKDRIIVNDAHLHFVDFVQETDGIDALISAMDRYGVGHTMLAGLPVVKMWDALDPVRPTYYLDNDARAYWYSATDMIVARAVAALPDDRRMRIHPFICGFNATDRNAICHVKRMMVT